MAKKRVAIIGGGSSGLCAIKSCLDEGMEPVCFERTNDIGGLWRFEEDPEEGRASIYKSVIINTSKEMMCFSDFPIPDDFPNYMHNLKIMEYFRMYAKHFDLLNYIHFKTSVCHVTRRPDFSATGQWDVVTETDGKQESSIFDGILVCSGHHTFAHLPLHTFPGIEKFRGRYLHSREYKNPQEFSDKKVIVIGIGNSGGDLAVEISYTAKQVFLSTRRGAWILNRVGDEGYPMDIVLSSRLNAVLKEFLTTSMVNKWAEQRLNARFSHSHYGLQPTHRILSQHPTVNDDLPNRIISGRVLVKPNVSEFTETAAIFEDGTKEDNIDVVVFATGYSFSFPFLESCVKVVDNQISLYKFVFPPHLEKPTLAFIGLVQPLGAIMPISELQCRWATRVFKGLNSLPSMSDMIADITQKKEEMTKRYVKSQRHTIQVDFVQYMDEIASLTGVKPNLLSLFLTDPKLAMEVFFGPCTPYQYRLRGPGKWDGARRAILTQKERIIKPMKTRSIEDSISYSSVPFLLKIVCGVVLFAVILAYF
ncbi:PREDICTED: dimethylaniline monooxygenase [N-oxide-forming] 5-like isoform X3 [Crocodylus porosus]|uniref:Flavin-containing monooxygenase n=2 Tax=Crocodylus porosus TaxID=8502 RepID=A0A7M4E7F2_CROPO|nr:PREDICTED: dimethylaniline monooxygenase [N-oxide-forming] 5-like isoform X3 [Crocodylus porosus]XP_019386306.1 PREDICTED: dimethylaniline monooxygenase [N-oxide-forming] 5-like isoform X3 [Crocodylus porosus]XP_019386308.1 PREDICTED: dimethylaniline monooxygenase [N-oxide-forming] 5-like isoform X3 [Crocodylus porosus]